MGSRNDNHFFLIFVVTSENSGHHMILVLHYSCRNRECLNGMCGKTYMLNFDELWTENYEHNSTKT